MTPAGRASLEAYTKEDRTTDRSEERVRPFQPNPLERFEARRLPGL